MIAIGIALIALLGGATAYGYKLGHQHASGDCAVSREVDRVLAIEQQTKAIKKVVDNAEIASRAATLVINELDQIRSNSNVRINVLLNRPKVICDNRPVITDEWMRDFTSVLDRTSIGGTGSTISGSTPPQMP